LERSEMIENENRKKNLFYTIKPHLIASIRKQFTEHGIELRRNRQFVRKWIILMIK
jgi:hypothetical protein